MDPITPPLLSPHERMIASWQRRIDARIHRRALVAGVAGGVAGFGIDELGRRVFGCGRETISPTERQTKDLGGVWETPHENGNNITLNQAIIRVRAFPTNALSGSEISSIISGDPAQFHLPDQYAYSDSPFLGPWPILAILPTSLSPIYTTQPLDLSQFGISSGQTVKLSFDVHGLTLNDDQLDILRFSILPQTAFVKLWLSRFTSLNRRLLSRERTIKSSIT